jgi:hypothetical protein
VPCSALDRWRSFCLELLGLRLPPACACSYPLCSCESERDDEVTSSPARIWVDLNEHGVALLFCAQTGREDVNAALVGNRRETVRGLLRREWLNDHAAVVPADEDRPKLRVDIPRAWQSSSPVIRRCHGALAVEPRRRFESWRAGGSNREGAPHLRLPLFAAPELADAAAGAPSPTVVD